MEGPVLDCSRGVGQGERTGPPLARSFCPLLGFFGRGGYNALKR
jgi:hypothetical protein